MWAKNRTRTHVLRNVGERSSRARVAKELAIRLSARTRQSRNPTSKRYIPAWSSQFSSSVSVSPHPSTPISQTPNQPTNVEPTRHTHSLPRGALHTSCSPPRQLRPLPWFAGVGAAPSPTSGGSERRRSAPPQRSPARAGELPAPSPRAEVKRSWRRTATRGRDWGGWVEEELAASSRRRPRLVFSPALRFRRRLAPHPLLLCLAPSRRSSGSSHGGGAGFPFLSGGASLSSGGLGSSSPPRNA
jgi:hypothetical protein